MKRNIHGSPMVNTCRTIVVVGMLLTGCATVGSEGNGISDSGVSAPGGDGKVIVVCPVSGVRVGPPQEAMSTTYKGQKYYFCCAGCKERFDADPEHFVGGPKSGN